MIYTVNTGVWADISTYDRNISDPVCTVNVFDKLRGRQNLACRFPPQTVRSDWRISEPCYKTLPFRKKLTQDRAKCPYLPVNIRYISAFYHIIFSARTIESCFFLFRYYYFCYPFAVKLIASAYYAVFSGRKLTCKLCSAGHLHKVNLRWEKILKKSQKLLQF